LPNRRWRKNNKSCIDNFTRIGKNAVVTNSAVMDRVIIGDNAEVYDSIIGRHVAVNSSYISQQNTAISVIADDVTIEEGCSLQLQKSTRTRQFKENSRTKQY